MSAIGLCLNLPAPKYKLMYYNGLVLQRKCIFINTKYSAAHINLYDINIKITPIQYS